jgi:hypothetical protein
MFVKSANSAFSSPDLARKHGVATDKGLSTSAPAFSTLSALPDRYVIFCNL